MPHHHAQSVHVDGFARVDVVTPFEVLAAGSDFLPGSGIAAPEESSAGRLPATRPTGERTGA